MTRASLLMLIVAVALGTATAAGAQELATGKWTGSYMRRTNQGLQGTGLVVKIDSVQEGVLRGSATIHGSQCAGDYPVAGKVADGKVQIHTTEQGGRGGRLRAAAQPRPRGQPVEGDHRRGTSRRTVAIVSIRKPRPRGPSLPAKARRSTTSRTSPTMALPAAVEFPSRPGPQADRGDNGTTHVLFEPLDFIARLAALLPKPRVHLTRFHGVFAPNSAHRAQVTKARRGRGARHREDAPRPSAGTR